jgi:NAD(P)-dependent dehydrogenase (short-subunit alcohol dehydrogenase family)
VPWRGRFQEGRRQKDAEKIIRHGGRVCEAFDGEAVGDSQDRCGCNLRLQSGEFADELAGRLADGVSHPAAMGNESRPRLWVADGAHYVTAWDVAEATVFLLSAHASYITGVTLPVDGGLSTIR